MHSFYFELFYDIFLFVSKKIAPAPAFTVDGVSRFDFGQGVLGRKLSLFIYLSIHLFLFIISVSVPCLHVFSRSDCV